MTAPNYCLSADSRPRNGGEVQIEFHGFTELRPRSVFRETKVARI